MLIKWTKILLLAILDAAAINLSYILSLMIRFEFELDNVQFKEFFDVYLKIFVAVTIIKIAVFWIFDLYNSLWKYAGPIELLKIFIGSLFATIASIAYITIAETSLPRSIYLLSFMLDASFLLVIRFSYRALRAYRAYGAQGMYEILRVLLANLGFAKPNLSVWGKTRVLLVGAGEAAAVIIREVRQSEELNKNVIIAVDDDPSKLGSMIRGVQIAGSTDNIHTLVKKYRIDEIIIAIPSLTKEDLRRIIHICNATGCKLNTLPGLSELINETVSVSKLREVDILDLLGREAVSLDIHQISSYLEDKTVLVTGGGGSIGSELCRQIAKFRPARLIALDVYENSLFTLEHEMRFLHPELEFKPVIASVRNGGRIRDVFNQERPHVVFHAAAHKHVPLMEMNPKEAVMNNLLGTKTVVDAAEEFKVERFVLISTDKAVNPTNVMGATKRAAEFIIQDKSRTAKATKFSAVRFGNVLGSNGSVIPLFKSQIERGGPVTITHKDITRYFMTIPEAVQLVIQAGAMASGGEIFVLDMGEPVKILDLAKNLIELSGYKPFVDIDISFVGLRPGEKLYEELLLAEEGIAQTNHSKIFIGKPLPMNQMMEELLTPDGSGIDEINRRLTIMSDSDVKQWLTELIPSYKPAQH